ncbi:MAG TPA: ABC transporter permease [Candidatus Rubrimentiphilum sp.]|nr:ABC transporter permease [Candidatus Rubrimentiphilum sp.]
MIAYLIEAANVLFANRMRSILTIIGLVVGVATIVAVQVAAAGMSGAVSGIFKGTNASTFIVFPKTTQSNVVRAALKIDDLALIRDRVPGVVSVIPFSRRQIIVDAGHQRVRLRFGGESDKRFSTSPVAAGRTLSAADIATADSACVISDNAFTRLFPNETSAANVLGQSLYVGSKRYVIVGVLGKAKVDTAALGFDVSNDVAIPYTTFYNTYQRGSSFFGVSVLASPDVNLQMTERRTEAVLAQAHGAQYQAFDFGFFAKTISGFFSVVGLIVGAVGAISLIVAGIGIMNIMLVSVTERTREIGIRKAIGARRGQVLAQFFVESLVLSAVGCLIGMFLGVGLGFFVDRGFIARISGVYGAIPWFEAIVIAVGFATLVTLGFGTYPAYRAARLDPIEALRYE